MKNYTGELKWDEESKKMQFFDLERLPEHQIDGDLVEAYKKYLNK